MQDLYCHPIKNGSRIFPGAKIGRLTLIAKVGKKPYGNTIWSYRCDCGKCGEAISTNIGRQTNSCGCLSVEKTSARSKTHGKSKKCSEYGIWCAIKRRCQNKSSKFYGHYGGRGITVCEKWETFEGFLDDMGDKPSDSHSIQRIDNDSGYSKENCCWATVYEQNSNKRNARYITFKGKTQPLYIWSDDLLFNYKNVWWILRRKNWDQSVIDEMFSRFEVCSVYYTPPTSMLV